MLKLTFSKPSIKTYNDGKVTICRYTCRLINKQSKQVVMEFISTGTSKCSPNDTLNEEYGRKLADSRAKLAAYKRAERIISPECYLTMLEELDRMTETLDFVDTMYYLRKKEAEHINTLNKTFG